MTTADIHTHTTYSLDSIIRPQELVGSAERAGIDIVCITDHSIFDENVGLESFNRKNKKPLVIRGVELATSNGELIIFGLKKNFWDELKNDMEILPPINAVIAEVNSFNGVAIWAHPFREYNVINYNTDYKSYTGVNIMETLNGRNSKKENSTARDYAQKHGFKMLGGSDAHRPGDVAKTLTLFKDNIETEAEFIHALKTSDYIPISYQEFKGKDLNQLLDLHLSKDNN